MMMLRMMTMMIMIMIKFVFKGKNPPGKEEQDVERIPKNNKEYQRSIKKDKSQMSHRIQIISKVL